MRLLAWYAAAGVVWTVTGIVRARASGIDILEGRVWHHALGLVIGVFTWPIGFLFAYGPRSLFPDSWRDAVMSSFRRDFMDREGLLEPQMPALRCPTHDVFLVDAMCGCGCKQVVPVCLECVKNLRCPKHDVAITEYHNAAGEPALGCAECRKAAS